MSWLHHPLRQEGPDPTHTWIREALDELEEVKATGDIFFPQDWVGGNLSGHRSPEAAAAVRGFLAERDDLPGHLRLKVLQAADFLFRAAGR